MNTPSVVACPNCNVALVPVNKRRAVSAGGAIGAVFIAAALIALLLSALPFAIGLAVIGVLCSAMSNRNITVMTCPQCGQTGNTLS